MFTPVKGRSQNNSLDEQQVANHPTDDAVAGALLKAASIPKRVWRALLHCQAVCT